jgi:hypothetical protein
LLALLPMLPRAIDGCECEAAVGPLHAYERAAGGAGTSGAGSG